MTPQGKNLGFKRHMYRLLDCEEDLVLLHYIGDHNIGSQHPHGNSKSNNLQVLHTGADHWVTIEIFSEKEV